MFLHVVIVCVIVDDVGDEAIPEHSQDLTSYVVCVGLTLFFHDAYTNYPDEYFSF